MIVQYDSRTLEEINRSLVQTISAGEMTRRKVQSAVGGVLFNVSNFPQEARTCLLGRDMAPLRDKITDAVLDALGIKVDA